MPKTERCKVNQPNVQNPNKSVRFLKTEHVWQPNDLPKRQNLNVRISDTYCIYYNLLLILQNTVDGIALEIFFFCFSTIN